MARTVITSKEDSLKEIKRLMEFHFKPHTRDESVENIKFEEEPKEVKFNEIGDTYSAGKVDNHLPTHEEYMEEVVKEAPAKAMPPETAKTPEKPKADTQPTQQPKQEPEISSEPAKPLPPPQSQVITKKPEEEKDEIKTILDRQISKTDELLAKIADMETKLASVDQVTQKIDKVEKEVDAIKPPSEEKRLDLISRNSYPFNVKLSDFWGDEEPNTEANKKPEPVKIKDVEDYDNSSIAGSFRPDVK